MSFLYPLFLLASLSLLIPILLHLFNLRKYKKTYFPNIGFLENVLITTKKSAQIQQKILLLTRMLLLLALVFAFAQPFLKKNKSGIEHEHIVLYIDNSLSMSYAEHQKTLLEKAKESALAYVQGLAPDAAITFIHNDQLSLKLVTGREKVIELIQNLTYSSYSFDLKKAIQNIERASKESNNVKHQLILISDFQKSDFTQELKLQDKLPIDIVVVDVRDDDYQNLYIDSTYFLNPFIDPNQSNKLVVHTQYVGSKNNIQSNIQVQVENQVVAMANSVFNENDKAIDTFDIKFSKPGWQTLTIALQDKKMSIDDTFYMALKNNPNLSCLVISNQTLSPYLQAAFNSFPNFNFKQVSINEAINIDWSAFSFAIFQNVTNVPNVLMQKLKLYVEQGNSVLLIPDIATNQGLANFSNEMQTILPITLSDVDTSTQQVSKLYQSHTLVEDVFAVVPDNVRLPATNIRYVSQSKVSANEDKIMTFKDGSSFLSVFYLEQGQIFFMFSPLDIRANNFMSTNYFAPILYKMATQARGGFVYSHFIGSDKPIFIPESGSGGRVTWQIQMKEQQVIPIQKPYGNGLQLFTDKQVNMPGVIQIANGVNDQSFYVGMNVAGSESDIRKISNDDLENYVAPLSIQFVKPTSLLGSNTLTTQSTNNWWMICAVLALIAIILETFLLVRKKKKVLKVA